MSLWPINELIRHARKHQYALGYFESWNLESLQGVLDAAETTGSPVIIGFNGEFLSRPGRKLTERIRCYAELGKAAAADTSVPCGLIFNECPNDDWVRDAVLAGFNLVMPADSSASYEDYRGRVATLTEFAHRHGAAVEGEVGHLPFGSSKLTNGNTLTDPELAARFVEDTKVDLLAVSVGNVHVLTKGKQELDLKRLSQIGERTNKPLVLHGGTGIPASSIREAIKLGVTKVNYGTYLKQRYLKALERCLACEADVDNPHELLGMGGEHDVMIAGRLAVRDAVLERIELLGCCGKAN
ncbi:MAG: class II fructose-bisphosphate aldolase [Verrucomicrobia bacterium]|nr:class II fructose-bisphosphate aldolase [Verrucomicrobiota bacterium]